METKLLSDIALICAIVALILAIIIPAIICYFGCICTCCCRQTRLQLEKEELEKAEKGKSVHYSVRSTRSQSKSREGGSRSKRAARPAEAPAMS